jgi:hypothetical protein
MRRIAIPVASERYEKMTLRGAWIVRVAFSRTCSNWNDVKELFSGI